MDRILRALWRRGLARGLGTGSRAWIAVALGAFGLRQLRRLSARAGAGVVLSERLRPGESLIITHTTRPRA